MTRLTIASSLVLALFTATAAAAAPSQDDVTLAEGLFREARKLMTEGRFAEACPKLAESQRIDPGGGTLLNLGLCHASLGKTATAWAELREALGQARREGRSDRVDIAAKKLSEIEPLLSRLTLEVPAEARVSGLELKLDDRVLGAATWDTALPIDPGSHTVVARAAGRRSFVKTVEVKPDHDAVRITVPILAPERVVQPAPKGLSGQQVAGLVVGGLGVLSVGIGSGFGVRAIVKEQEAEERCGDKLCSTMAAKQASDDAQAAARIADITIGVGLAAVGAGVIVFIVGKRGAPAPSSAVIPVAGRSGGGAVWRGSW